MNTLDVQELQKYLDSTTASDLPMWVEKNRPQSSKGSPKDEAIHVSVNMKLDRFYHFIETGELEQFNLENRLHDLKLRVEALKKPKKFQLGEIFEIFDREINELCFGRQKSSISPIYGALNHCSLNGGAPYFGEECWLKLQTDRIKSRTTFTPKDSGDLTNHKWSNFSAQMGCRIIKDHIMEWESAIVSFEKTHTHNTHLCADLRNYIEAQIWGGVMWDDIEEIYIVTYDIKRNLEPIVVKDFEKRRIIYQSNRVCRDGIWKPFKINHLKIETL